MNDWRGWESGAPGCLHNQTALAIRANPHENLIYNIHGNLEIIYSHSLLKKKKTSYSDNQLV